jgi:O-acetyl-ADP-ribose deacetylase (regulator of RNase III)
MALAAANNVRTIAFPAISAGAYGFPLDRAARIAVAETLLAVGHMPQFEMVTHVCFDSSTRAGFRAALSEATRGER